MMIHSNTFAEGNRMRKTKCFAGVTNVCKVMVCVLFICGMISQQEGYRAFASGNEVEISNIHKGEYVHGYIAKDGDLYLRGKNTYGLLGINNEKENLIVFNPVKVLGNVKQFAQSAGSNAVALCVNGDVYAWGRYVIGNNENQLFPLKIAENAKKVDISHDNYILILLENGDLVQYRSGTNKVIASKVRDCFGDIGIFDAYISEQDELYMRGTNERGELGVGDTTNRYYNYVKVMDNVMEFDMGGQTSAAITFNGELYMWGANDFCKVGNGSTEDVLLPTKIMDGVREICVGEEHVVALNQKNELYSWGNNTLGQVGIGNNEGDNICIKYPLKVMDNIAHVTLQKRTIETLDDKGASVSASGASFAIALDGTLYSWGCNRECALGIGKTFDEQKICLEPTYVASNVKSIEVDEFESIYLDAEGNVYQAGRDLFAEKYTQNVFPVKISVENSGITDILGFAGSSAITTNTNVSMVYVHDLESNKGIKGAIVEVIDENGSVLESVPTDKDGFAMITSRSGAYSLKTTADQYFEYFESNCQLDSQCFSHGLTRINDKPMVLKALVRGSNVLTSDVKVLNNVESDDVEIYAYFVYNNNEGDTISRVELLQGNKVLRARNATSGVDLESGYTLFQLAPDELEEEKKVYIRAISAKGVVGPKTETKINVVKGADVIYSIDGDYGVEIDFPSDLPFLEKCKFKLDLADIPICLEFGEEGSIRAGVNFISYDEEDGISSFFKSDKEWNDIKDAVKSKKTFDEYIKKNNKTFKKVKKDTFKSVFNEDVDIEIEVWGYGEGTVKTGEIECEVVAKVIFKGGSEIPVQCVVIPLVFSVEVEAEFEGNMKLEYNIKKFEGGIVNGGIKMTLGLELGVGPGIPKIVSATVGARGELMLDRQWGEGEYLDVDLSLTGQIKVKALFVSTTIEVKPITKHLIDTRELATMSVTEDMITLFSMNDLTNVDSYEVMERDYLSNQSSWNPMVKTRSISSSKQLLQASIYDDPNLHYVESNGTRMIVFLTDSAERNDANRTLLVYSVYDEETATWGTPIAIDDTGMADFTPSVYENENGIHIVWSSAKSAINDSDSIVDSVSKLEVKYASWNEAERNFEVKTITDDEVYQTFPRILETGDDIYVAWVENANNNIFCLDDANCVKLYSVNNQSVVLEQEIATPLELSLAYENNKVLLAVICDNDYDYLTVDDHHLMVWNVDGTVVVDEVGNISAVKNYQDKLFWLEDGVLTCNEGLYFGFDKKVTDQYQIIEEGTDKYILFRELENISSVPKTSLLAYSYNAEKNAWENKIVISDTDENIQEFVAFINSSGDISSVFVACSTADDEYGTQVASMYSDIYVNSCDLELSEVSYSDVVLNENGTYSLDVDTVLINRGATTKNNITFSLMKNGESVATSTQSIVVETGSDEEVSVEFDLGDNLELGIYTVDVAIDEVERNLDNNSQEIYLGRPDIAVDYSAVGNYDDYVLAVSVSNLGYDTADCVFNLRKDSRTGESIFSKELGVLAAGEVKSFLIEVDAGILTNNDEDLFLYLCVDSNNENETSLGNNDAYCLIKPAEKSTAVLEISEQYIRLDIGEEAILTATLSSFTEREESDIEWESLDELVAFVDMSGKVRATGAGTTQIRAKANNMEVICTVEVVGEVEHPNLKFDKVNLTLYSDLSINFKVLKSLFLEAQYSSPYAQFMFGNEIVDVTEYKEEGDYYVFTYSNIAPDKMNDTIQATLFATYEDEVVQGESISYGVGEYCYKVLEVYAEGQAYEETRRMFVDLLNYGAASQLYTGYKTDQLVNSMLTEVQKTYGTSATPMLESITDKAFVENENAVIEWKSASLYLYNTIAIRVKFSAESIDGVKAKIECAGKEYWYDETEFVYDESSGIYMVEFDRLNPAQLREACYFTVYSQDGTALSNTLRFSAESYAYVVQGYQNNLSDMIIAMMKYGDSAYSYIN